MRNKVKICLITLLMAMFACSVAALCSCAEDPPYYGSYYNDDSVITITDDAFYLGSTTDLYKVEYKYKYEDEQIYLYVSDSAGYYPFMTIYEDNQVICIDMLKNLGLVSADKPTTRDGYFDATMRIMENYEITEFYDFSSSGSFSHTSIDPFSKSSGTYTLNSGVITVNLTSKTTYYETTSVNRQWYLYIDSEYNVYFQAWVKDPELFAENSSGTQTPTLPGDDETSGDDGQTETTPQTYTINYIAGENGKIIGTTTQTVQEGEDGNSVIAVADDGYEFVGWSDGVTTAERTDTNVTGDITVTAIFEKIPEYTLIYSATDGGYVEGTATQTVQEGESGETVIAVADDGYEFIGWSDGVTTAERTDTNVTENITVTAIFEAVNTTQFAGGSGSESNPYKIATLEHLQNMSLYPDAHYILISDITLPQVDEGQSNFTPLFSDETMFNGTLDGNGHTIYNLTIYNTSTFYTGLFSCIGEEGSVTNLTLENVDLYGTNYTGGIAGYALGAITDCEVSGKITYVQQNTYSVFIGGIAGRAENSVDGCASSVEIVAEDVSGIIYAGGIAGYYAYNMSNSETALTVYSSADIDLTTNGDTYAGGIFGSVNTKVSLTYSYATGDIEVTAANSVISVGGLMGYCSTTTLTSCYATENIEVTTDSNKYVYVGGIVGEFDGTQTLTSCFTIGNIEVTTNRYCYVGGLIGYSHYGGTLTSCYTTGDITVTTNSGAARVGGLIGDCMGTRNTFTSCYTIGNIEVTANSSSYFSYVGGLIGYFYYSSNTLTSCYTIGDIMVTNNTINSDASIYAGGLIGYGSVNILTSCYTTGDIVATNNGTNGSTYAGGLIGYLGSRSITSSYTTSLITVEGSAETNYIGALVGWVDGLTITNAHWLYYAESGVEYAVGYNSDMGMPTNIGATKHTDIADFYTLADVLNDGLDTAVWENVGENSLPTLKEENN